MAWGTKFSDAIISSVDCWRCSSLASASATSGSTSASDCVKKSGLRSEDTTTTLLCRGSESAQARGRTDGVASRRSLPPKAPVATPVTVPASVAGNRGDEPPGRVVAPQRALRARLPRRAVQLGDLPDAPRVAAALEARPQEPLDDRVRLLGREARPAERHGVRVVVAARHLDLRGIVRVDRAHPGDLVGDD